MFRLSLYILAILAIGTGLILGTLNADSVAVDLLWWQFVAPLGGTLVLTFVFGTFIGIFAIYVLRIMPLRMALRRALKSQTKSNPDNGDSQASRKLPTKDA